jgi:hypothetical protein
MRSQALILLLFLMGLRTTSDASCKKARPDQTPHGANELILLEERTVRGLRGVVSIGYDGGPASDVVVEIYRYEGEADGFKMQESLKGAKRSTACITTENGRFAFPHLKAGRYLLRAGTDRSMGINEVYAIFKVTDTGKTHDIEIRLPLGT